MAQPSLPCFVDATPCWVAGIAGQGGFAFSLPAPHPIFEAEFLASFYGIGMYRPISNNIHLIGNNLGVLFCLKRGSSRNLFANESLKNLAYFCYTHLFFLKFRILNQLIIQLILYSSFLIDRSVFGHVPGVLCVLQNFTLIRDYVFRDFVRLQLIIWPYNFAESWFLGVGIFLNFAEFLGIPLVFAKQ